MRYVLFAVGVGVISSAATLAAGWWYITAFGTDSLTVWQEPSEETVELNQEQFVSDVSIPDMVASTSPAVVSVVIVAEVPVVEQYYDEWLSPFGGFFGMPMPRQRQVGTEEQEIGGGSGFIVSPDGYIITNRHVVESDEARYQIVLDSGKRYDAEVVARDAFYDIAVLQIDPEDTELPFLQFGQSDTLRLGETVIAIGNALAEFPNSVSVGVVSGLARNITASDGYGAQTELENVIQTDAAINRGNSGGPLLNTQGEVVGVNVATARAGENVSFALPASVASDIFASIETTGTIERPFLGIRYLEINDMVQEANNLTVDYGVIVLRGERREELAVIPDSPAAKADIREGDILLELNGERLTSDRSLAGRLRAFAVGDTVEILVRRDGEEFTVPVTLEAAPQS